MDTEDMQTRIEELEEERDSLQDQLAAATEELTEANRRLETLQQIASGAADSVRAAHELLERGDF
jgi:prefoldin subunit 5